MSRHPLEGREDQWQGWQRQVIRAEGGSAEAEPELPREEAREHEGEGQQGLHYRVKGIQMHKTEKGARATRMTGAW